jgi:hypothetical protein
MRGHGDHGSFPPPESVTSLVAQEEMIQCCGCWIDRRSAGVTGAPTSLALCKRSPSSRSEGQRGDLLVQLEVSQSWRSCVRPKPKWLAQANLLCQQNLLKSRFSAGGL